MEPNPSLIIVIFDLSSAVYALSMGKTFQSSQVFHDTQVVWDVDKQFTAGKPAIKDDFYNITRQH